jgi:nucleoside-diphosphate-sugar epimerase
MQNGTIILCGGAGLVGQNLLVRLLDAGQKDILVIDKHPANVAILRRMHPQVEVIEADLCRPGPWQDRMAGAGSVVMLQAQIGGLDLAEFERNNVESTRMVIEQIRRHDIPYTVHISSSVVESVANDFYTQTKKAQEELVMQSGIRCITLRPTLMFGWFDRKHLGWLSRFMKKVPVFPIPGHGRYMRQPLYVGDFCQIIMSCLASRKVGGAYNISGHDKVDYIDIIRQIKRVTKASAVIVRIPYPVFHALLAAWALFDRNPPFTTQQLAALVARDEFEVIDWPGIFGVATTPFPQAIEETFCDPRYGNVVLEF